MRLWKQISQQSKGLYNLTSIQLPKPILNHIVFFGGHAYKILNVSKGCEEREKGKGGKEKKAGYRKIHPDKEDEGNHAQNFFEINDKDGLQRIFLR